MKFRFSLIHQSEEQKAQDGDEGIEGVEKLYSSFATVTTDFRNQSEKLWNLLDKMR